MERERDEALERAIREAGNGMLLAAAIGVTPQAVGQWSRVPPRRVLDVERASGVPRTELRPDIYPPEPKVA